MNVENYQSPKIEEGKTMNVENYQSPKIEDHAPAPAEPAPFVPPTLEASVPVPTGVFGPREKGPRALFVEKMQPGQSFVVPDEEAKKYAAAGKSVKRKMVTRREGQGTMRVWYVGPYEPKPRAPKVFRDVEVKG